MRRFPIFQSDKVARCLQCGALLKDHQDSGYGPGDGGRRGKCVAGCDSWTWYDSHLAPA